MSWTSSSCSGQHTAAGDHLVHVWVGDESRSRLARAREHVEHTCTTSCLSSCQDVSWRTAPACRIDTAPRALCYKLLSASRRVERAGRTLAHLVGCRPVQPAGPGAGLSAASALPPAGHLAVSTPDSAAVHLLCCQVGSSRRRRSNGCNQILWLLERKSASGACLED